MAWCLRPPTLTTPGRIAELIDWYNAATQDHDLHPLLLIGIFVVVFALIHQFQDGNGRLQPDPDHLAALRSGYAYVPYSSLESVIEQSKEAYYLALRQTQGTIRSDTPDWGPWLGFLSALQRQMLRLRSKVERERLLMGSLPEVSAKLLDLVRDHGRPNNRRRRAPDRPRSQHAEATLAPSRMATSA